MAHPLSARLVLLAAAAALAAALVFAVAVAERRDIDGPAAKGPSVATELRVMDFDAPVQTLRRVKSP